MRRPILQSLFLGTERSRTIAKSARLSGDQASRARDWSNAVLHYREYLAARPKDDAIRIQLGHAYKESGSFDEALAAYLGALERRPRDADLLLNIGHLHKLTGDRDAALAFYRRSADENGNRHALAEIDYLLRTGATPALAPDLAKVQAILARQVVGMTPVDVSDMTLAAKASRIQFVSHDPWVVFELDGTIAAAAGLGLLTIEARPVDPDHVLSGQLFVDYGDGFEENTSLPFISGPSAVSLLLAAPEQIKRVRWDPDRKTNVIHLPRLAFTSVDDVADAERLLRDTASVDLDVAPLIELAQICFDRAPIAPREAAEATLALMVSALDLDDYYRGWLLKYERPSLRDYTVIAAMTEAMTVRPTFSFVMPTYNSPIPLLRAAIDAMLKQTYANFEICIVDDHSPNPEVVEVLADYAARDPRVRYLRSPANGHISDASNRALALATGDYVVLVDHDDTIPDYTLFVVAYYLNQHPDADVLFSDEDKIDIYNNRFAPYFKGSFSKFLMYGHNMVSHLGVYRRSLVSEIGGFRVGLEGSQDYDLLLRCYERSTDARIVHIPHVLYHWRTTPGSTSISPDQKGYAILAAQRAINDHFERTGMPFRSGDGFAPGCTGVTPTKTFDTPISIIIPTRNGLDDLTACVDSILKTTLAYAEILIVDNGSDDPATLAYLDTLAADGVARVLRYDQPFNFSLINNFAAAQAMGDILCFLNNDTEIQTADWLNRARALLSLDEVGIVGARLLYPDHTLQHFGIVLGMGDHGIAGTPHGGIDANDPGYFGKARLMQEFSAVTAACMFIRKDDFIAVGGFEPELRVAYNDVDLCLKIRAKNLKIVGDPEILLIHKESKTRGSDKQGERAMRLADEAAWMRATWGTILADDPYYSPNLAINRPDFSRAIPPRLAMPWRRQPGPAAQS